MHYLKNQPTCRLREKNDKGLKNPKKEYEALTGKGRQMPLVVFSEFSGFEMSE